MREGFKLYLIEKGYKQVTPSGKPSTVYDYLKRIDRICQCEHMTYEALASQINRLIMEYGAGGVKETAGKQSHNAVINALRRYCDFVTQTNNR